MFKGDQCRCNGVTESKFPSLSSEVMGIPSLEAFKATLDGAVEQPGLVGGDPAYRRGVGTT